MKIKSLLKNYPRNKVLTSLEEKDPHNHISLLLLNAHYSLLERNESGELLDNVNTLVCEYCARHYSYESFTVDHFNPRYFNGTNALENLKIVCEQCNKAKGAIDPETMPGTFSKLLAELKKGVFPRRLTFLQEIKKRNPPGRGNEFSR